MKKRAARAFICVFVVLSLVGCRGKHNGGRFIGKTSAEIEIENGQFDCVLAAASEDGLYKNCRCGYTIREAKKGFFGASPEVLLFIIFDENGKAIACEEGNRPGG